MSPEVLRVTRANHPSLAETEHVVADENVVVPALLLSLTSHTLTHLVVARALHVVLQQQNATLGDQRCLPADPLVQLDQLRPRVLLLQRLVHARDHAVQPNRTLLRQSLTPPPPGESALRTRDSSPPSQAASGTAGRTRSTLNASSSFYTLDRCRQHIEHHVR